jgi:hypothetical protein
MLLMWSGPPIRVTAVALIPVESSDLGAVCVPEMMMGHTAPVGPTTDRTNIGMLQSSERRGIRPIRDVGPCG